MILCYFLVLQFLRSGTDYFLMLHVVQFSVLISTDRCVLWCLFRCFALVHALYVNPGSLFVYFGFNSIYIFEFCLSLGSVCFLHLLLISRYKLFMVTHHGYRGQFTVTVLSVFVVASSSSESYSSGLAYLVVSY